MKNWINKNYKTLIIAAFLVPIITVAVVSISHVTTWYGISNPVTWSVYLSIGIEIAALSALAAISANMGSKVYFPFAIVTLVQFIGNIFFAYTYININSQQFKDWVDLVSPLVEYMGVESTDFVGHKRFLAFFAGGMLPVISLSFLHMLVKFTEEDRKKQNEVIEEKPIEENKIDASDLVGEVSRLRLSDEDLKKLEEVLLNPPSPNEALINAAKKYQEKSDEEILKRADEIRLKKVFEDAEKIKKQREEEYGPDDNEQPTSLANSQYRELDVQDDEDWGGLTNEELIGEDEIPNTQKPLSWEERGEILSEMMRRDQELGLYDLPVETPTPTPTPTPSSTSTETPMDSISEVYPALSDEEVREMFMDEWERKFDLVEEEEEISSITEPTEEEEQQNFSTIESNNENIFQEEVKTQYQSQIDNINQMLTELENETFTEEPTTLFEEAVTEEILTNDELVAIQDAIENETVPEPFATPEEIELQNNVTPTPSVSDEEVEKKNS